MVHGKRAPVSDLSPDEAEQPVLRPTFALRPGQVFQSRPYVSPDTHDWVIGNATPIPLGAQRRSVAIVHYELSVESFRRELRADDGDVRPAPRRRAHRPRDHRQLAPPAGRGAARRARRPPLRRPGATLAARSGVTTIDGHVAAYRHLRGGDGNANDWIVVAVARRRRSRASSATSVRRRSPSWPWPWCS